VDHGEKFDHMRSLGADEVIDYRGTDFTGTGERYDLILDLVGTRSASAVRRALVKGGTYTMAGGTMRAFFQILLIGPVVGALSGTRIRMLAAESHRQTIPAGTGRRRRAVCGRRAVAGKGAGRAVAA
jgi:NADPH:quinone reductase-like Zn-dependent oxidoreductase